MKYYLYSNIKEFHNSLNFLLDDFSYKLKTNFYRLYLFKTHLSIQQKFLISNLFLYFFKFKLKDQTKSFFSLNSLVKTIHYF